MTDSRIDINDLKSVISNLKSVLYFILSILFESAIAPKTIPHTMPSISLDKGHLLISIFEIKEQANIGIQPPRIKPRHHTGS